MFGIGAPRRARCAHALRRYWPIEVGGEYGASSFLPMLRCLPGCGAKTRATALNGLVECVDALCGSGCRHMQHIAASSPVTPSRKPRV